MADQKAAEAAVHSEVFDANTHPELFEEILPRRLIAFAFDALIVFVASIPAFIAVAILGVVTFGLGWLLFPFVFGLVALGYLALTLGSSDSATIGMRAAGIEMRTLGGERMYPVLAVLQGLVFWILTGALTPFVLIVGLFGERRRLLHDMLLGTIMLNSKPLTALERTRGVSI